MAIPKILSQLYSDKIAIKLGKYKGKYLSIMGDSISAYIGTIPSGATPYYTDVANFPQSKIWWQRLIDQTGMILCVNNSWSKSPIAYNEASGSALPASGDRSIALHTEIHEPDVIIIFMGINDFSFRVPLGTYDGAQPFPIDNTTFREAYAIMLNKIMTRYPLAEVYCGTEPCFSQTFPQANGDNIFLASYNKAIKEIAELFGVRVIDFNKAYTPKMFNQISYNGTDGHPNSLGHYKLSCIAIKEIDPTSNYSPSI